MTNITVYKTGNRYRGFTLEGHAGYDKQSKDIVCASISVLAINTINSIENLTSDVPNVETDEKSGLIRCFFSEEPSKETTLLLDSMFLGFTEIKNEYGKKFIDIKFQEV